ncbi:hypothetical protein JOB18_013658 [Solea senegalensis]|uniref:Uncharacterized protein n=1 Tax=Solea senegalensis TaxID=28829 RepID=A0AAV6SSQ9_SOLSE|nr:hypothetical protein JOB18_013658 [Solea senegalensis]
MALCTFKLGTETAAKHVEGENTPPPRPHKHGHQCEESLCTHVTESPTNHGSPRTVLPVVFPVSVCKLRKKIGSATKKNYLLKSQNWKTSAPDDLGGWSLLSPFIVSEAPQFPQTHTHSKHGDDTPFQQLCSRPYEMGWVAGL